MANEVFTNNEIVFAKTPKEFKQLIDYYINNPNERLSYMQSGLPVLAAINSGNDLEYIINNNRKYWIN